MKKHLLLFLALAATTLSSQAQTAISANGVAPDGSAMLDVDVSSLGATAKKGFLIPRVALLGTTDAATIPSPQVSLMVYNTNTAGGVTPGFYYNAGTILAPIWTRFITTNSTSPTGSGTLNMHAKWTPDGVTLGNSIVYDNGTNVGISSTSPGGKLDVFGGPITLSAGYLDANRDAYAQNGISWYAQNYPSWSTYMSPAAATSTGPHADLTAPSGIYVTSWALRNYIENAGGYGWTFESAANTTTPGVKFEIRASDGLFHSYGDGYVDGVVYAGASARMGTGITAGYYQDATNGAYRSLVSSATTNGYYFQTNAGGTTTMYVGLGGTYNGNVGIGNTGPSAKLHVSGGGQILGTNGTSSNTRTLTILEDGDAQTNYGTYPGAWTSALQIQDNTTSRFIWMSPLDNASGNNSRLMTAATGLDIYTNGSASSAGTLGLTVTAAGLVGVGTASPGFKLHVPSGYIGTDYINTTDNSVASGVSGIMVKAGDNYLRTGTAASVLSFLGVTAPTGDNLGNHSATTTLAMNANRISNARGMEIYTGDGSGWGDNAYAIFREDGVWTFPYPDLRIAYHTGIKLGANSSYNGIRFYNDYNMATQTMSVGDGDNNVRIYYDLRVPFIYDLNDYGYYMDPNSYSNMYMVNRQRGFNSTEYDYNNTAYYMDLNNTSNVYALYRYYGFNGREYDGNDGGYYVDPNGYTNLWQLQTNNITYTSYGGDQTYVGWGWAYNYGYYCTYSCGWWNYSSCGTTCYDYYNKMQVNGRAYSYSWANFSDGRLKTNIGTISNALDMVKSMRGVTYDWKTNEATRAEAIKNADPVYISEPDKKAEKLQSQVGFIAQEIQNILPSAVSQIEEKDSTGAIIGTTLGVDYTSVIPVLVEAIKELKKELDEMKAAMAMNSNATTPVQQTIYNAPPTGANSMSAGKTNSNNLSVKDAVKLLEDNLSFMTKEHQEQMKDFIKEIKSSDKLTPDQLSKVLEFRNNIKEFQKNK